MPDLNKQRQPVIYSASSSRLQVARAVKESLTQKPEESRKQLSDLVFCLRPLLTDESPVRAGTFRALRYLIHKPADVEELLEKRLHVYISRALEQQARQALNERMQALKLVQKMLQVSTTLPVQQNSNSNCIIVLLF